MTEEFMKEEKKITSQFDSDPSFKTKIYEKLTYVRWKMSEKETMIEAQQDLARARLMQQGDNCRG